MGSQAAILTGDLIGSTKAGHEAVDRAMTVLRNATVAARGWTGGDTRFTRYRGDGWQVYCADSRMAMRLALFLVAHLRADDGGLATRIAVGVGEVQALRDDLSNAAGEAFEASGRALEDMDKGRRLTAAPARLGALRAAFVLADAVSQGWSQPQAETLCFALVPDAPSQEVMATELGVSQNAVWKRLQAASFPAVEAALAALEEAWDVE